MSEIYTELNEVFHVTFPTLFDIVGVGYVKDRSASINFYEYPLVVTSGGTEGKRAYRKTWRR